MYLNCAFAHSNEFTITKKKKKCFPSAGTCSNIEFITSIWIQICQAADIWKIPQPYNSQKSSCIELSSFFFFFFCGGGVRMITAGLTLKVRFRKSKLKMLVTNPKKQMLKASYIHLNTKIRQSVWDQLAQRESKKKEKWSLDPVVKPGLYFSGHKL